MYPAPDNDTRTRPPHLLSDTRPPVLLPLSCGFVKYYRRSDPNVEALNGSMHWNLYCRGGQFNLFRSKSRRFGSQD